MSSYCRQKREHSLYNLAASSVGSCRTVNGKVLKLEVAPSAVDRVSTVATDVTQFSSKVEYCSVLGDGGEEAEPSHTAPSGNQCGNSPYGRTYITYNLNSNLHDLENTVS
jgi:hypothetical protein